MQLSDIQRLKQFEQSVNDMRKIRKQERIERQVALLKQVMITDKTDSDSISNLRTTYQGNAINLNDDILQAAIEQLTADERTKLPTLLCFPAKMRTHDLCLEYVSRYPATFVDVPPMHKHSEEIQLKALEDPLSFACFYTEVASEKVYALAAQSMCNFNLLPKRFKTRELTVQYVQYDNYALSELPSEHIKLEYCYNGDQLRSDIHTVELPVNVACADPRILVTQKSRSWPRIEDFDALITQWIMCDTIHEDDIKAVLSNAPLRITKSPAWKKWALVLLD